MARTTTIAKQTDNLGNTPGSDLLAGYSNANSDENAGGTSYYGFVDSEGNWYIQRMTTTDIDYVRGSSNYATNWTNRASLSYDKFNAIF